MFLAPYVPYSPSERLREYRGRAWALARARTVAADQRLDGDVTRLILHYRGEELVGWQAYWGRHVSVLSFAGRRTLMTPTRTIPLSMNLLPRMAPDRWEAWEPEEGGDWECCSRIGQDRTGAAWIHSRAG